MDTSQEPTHCEYCGKKIPLRLGPQGRVKRFCSGACRAAASRKRREDAHTRELVQAREQMSFALHSRDDTAREAAKILREIADGFRTGERAFVSPAVGELIAASHEMVIADIESRQAQEPQKMNRAQRRRQKRR